MKDKVFTRAKKFEFDSEVASVFDDMLHRSVPFYDASMALVSDLILLNAKANDIILDIGCSTGNTLRYIAQKSKNKLNLIGIDSSKPMIQRASAKANAYGIECEFIHIDALEYTIPAIDFVISSYTMQFIPMPDRQKLLSHISKALAPNGFFIMSEKIIYDDKTLNKNIVDIYYEFKQKNGYSDIEIANKKEALENVLIPLTIKENIQMLKSSGFDMVDTVFQWGNFVIFLCKKDS